MTSAQQKAALTATNCELAFDALTCRLYATDASLYEIEPVAVAFPRGARQASALVVAAAQAGIAVIPRGAGTGLAGGAIGEGLVLDFSRYNREIGDLDLERRTVRVGPGVVLDQLNQFLRPHGFAFGPDVATSSRATLGGMIANNSSGARAPLYGTTADHIRELEIVLADGQVVMAGSHHDTLRRQRELVRDLVYFHSLTIEERFPVGLVKRWPGYGMDRCAREPNNLCNLLCGSEGTLAAILSAEVGIVPLPAEKGLGLVFFDSVAEAMEASVRLLDLQPAAIEHIDRVLLDQTRCQRTFQAARDLLDLEQRPCEALLVVEFYSEVAEKFTLLRERRLGTRMLTLQQPAQMALVWELRKAGLSLLTGRKGSAKPATAIEDVAVRPEQLPAYVAGLQRLLGRLDLEASFYGHAGAGLLHVRPILDLRSVGDRKKFRELAGEVSALVREFRGSLAGEHGVGIARTEFLPEQLGESLLGVMREIKASFDPFSLFNPGKLISDGRHEIDSDLRVGTGRALEVPFTPVLAFAAKDGSFLGNLEQCNGCGGCRKETPAMCPTFPVTGLELMSTRGRANAIRSLLKSPLDGQEPAAVLGCAELQAALGSCLSCRACATECPSNVNLSLLKAELAHARIRREGLSWRERLFGAVDVLGAMGCFSPRVANRLLDSLLVRSLLSKLFEIAWQRPLPHYARERFDRWFARRRPSVSPGSRGRVLLWDDTFVRYHEPHIGVAAVKVLEAAGFSVELVHGRKCCGRPAFSQGDLDRARRLGRHNVALLERDTDGAPVLFLEPSCFSMFAEDYHELKIEGAKRVAERCFLFEQFIETLLDREPGALRFPPKSARVIIHAHCHARSVVGAGFLHRLAARLPGREVTLLDTGCCGMAGGFGMLEKNYELSLKIAEPLIQRVRSQPYGTIVVASGTSCRHQITHLAPIRPRHMVEVLADALEE